VKTTRPWSLVSEADYRRLPLRAHELLHEVPLHDVWRVVLPYLGHNRTMLDVRTTVERAGKSRRMGVPVRALFRLRWWMGRVLRWDSSPGTPNPTTFMPRLSDADRQQSLVEPGTCDGPFTVLFVHPAEAVSEIRNATVHGFVVWALEPVQGGYHLFLAVHVLPVGRWTRPYMVLIDPFRRWLVYPALLRGLHQTWLELTATASHRP
jgi:hypothetical protein